MAKLRWKAILSALLITTVGVLVSLPFAMIHPLLPFIVLLAIFVLSLGMKRWRWVSRLSTTYLVGFLIAILVLLPAVSAVGFIERGFDDGPFYGKPYRGVISGESASDRLDYQQGELLIYNRRSERSPILAYREDELRWAVEMDVSQNPAYSDYQLVSIESPTLSRGILRDRLNFLGTWSFGKESGKAYIWKWGGLHRFYLSW